MQQKLRKMGIWIWEKKERMVFAIMVLFLGWRVYQVVYPPEVEEITNIATPSATGQMDVPPPPTGNPLNPLNPPNTGALTARNPFWYYATSNEGAEDGSGPSVEISLIGFQELPRGTYVRLKVGTDKTRSYREGDKFQTFVLTTVDSGGQFVEVIDQSNNETYLIELEEE